MDLASIIGRASDRIEYIKIHPNPNEKRKKLNYSKLMLSLFKGGNIMKTINRMIVQMKVLAMSGFALGALALAAHSNSTAEKKFLCEDTLELKKIEQTVLKSSDGGFPTVVSKSTVSKISEMAFPNEFFNYKMLESFEGACTLEKKRQTYAEWSKNGVEKSDSLNFWVQLNDSSTLNLNGSNFAQWFGWHSKESGNSVKMFVGRADTNQMFQMIKAWVVLEVKERASSGIWQGPSYRMVSAVGLDTLKLLQDIMAKFAGETFNENRKGEYRALVVKLQYDRASTGTSALQTKKVSPFNKELKSYIFNGQLTLKMDPETASDSPVHVYNMLGEKVKELYPVGYEYLWNGHFENGRQAPNGVYFLKRNNKIIDKVFYHNP